MLPAKKVEPKGIEPYVWGIVGGLAVSFCYAPYAVFGNLIAWGSVCAIAYDLVNRSKLDKLWQGLGLVKGDRFPQVRKRFKTEHGTTYNLSLPPGLSLADFDRNKIAIEQYLACPVRITYQPHVIVMECFEKIETYFEYQYVRKPGMTFLVGYDLKGTPVFLDLAGGEPHMIVAGETGSGKSVCLRGIITTLILKGDVDIFLIDYKLGAEFKVFERAVKALAKNFTEANKLLNQASAECDRRYKLLEQADCVDIDEYRRKGFKLNSQVIIVDEFAEMESEKDGLKRIQSLTAKARAAGIYIILATQRPSADVVNGRIKANCTNVVGLKTSTAVNSRVIIDHDGLEKLRGRGHAILKHKGQEIELQCPMLTVERARELIRHKYREKEVVRSDGSVDLDVIAI